MTLTDGLSSLDTARARSAELDAAIDRDPAAFTVLTGDRPTGPLHIGHLLGTIANRVRLQDRGVDVTVLIADYQVLTDRSASGRMVDDVRGQVADYLACGIDPDRSTVFCHSAVPELNELMLPLLSLVTDAELRRNPTVKAESAAAARPMSGLMLTYPVHQAADILSCNANLVPVGADQLPHLELTRTLARRFNSAYGAGILSEPEALLTVHPLLPGFDGTKMSTSRGNGISLAMTPDETAVAIRRAPTDGIRQISYDPAGRPGITALLDIHAAVTGADPAGTAERIWTGGASALKAELTEAVDALLRPIRARRRHLLADAGQLDAILAGGNRRARTRAAETLRRVHDALGMSYASS